MEPVVIVRSDIRICTTCNINFSLVDNHGFEKYGSRYYCCHECANPKEEATN